MVGARSLVLARVTGYVACQLLDLGGCFVPASEMSRLRRLASRCLAYLARVESVVDEKKSWLLVMVVLLLVGRMNLLLLVPLLSAVVLLSWLLSLGLLWEEASLSMTLKMVPLQVVWLLGWRLLSFDWRC